jgi:hypothetical protein
MKNEMPIRGYLLHITHHDPVWWKNKARERRFNLPLALEAVETMARSGLNTLVVDCEDGVKYRSHPELARPYTAPMEHLVKLSRRARELGIEVVPKLNFSQSHLHHHNDWFRPHHELFDNAEYWKRSFRIIDELRRATKTSRFFHVGMDEDHNRSLAQYVSAIKTLRDGLKKRRLRAVIWNDTAIQYGPGLVHAERSEYAESRIPRDVVEVLWNYWSVQPAIVKRLRRLGFAVWIAPGRNPEQVRAWRKVGLKLGVTGMLMTQWIPCQPKNRERILGAIRQLGPLY